MAGAFNYRNYKGPFVPESTQSCQRNAVITMLIAYGYPQARLGTQVPRVLPMRAE